MTDTRLWTILLSVLLLITLPFSVAADTNSLKKNLTRDFAPLGGYIVLELDEEYLVDIDGNDGARSGDLLHVYRKGEEIIHPVTGEVLGSLDDKIAVLSLTKIKSGYSYARVISGTTKLTKGTPFKRFSGLNAGFKGHGPGAEKLYSELSLTLPTLDWQGFNTANTGQESVIDILFALTGNQLEVRNSVGELIHSYPADEYISVSGSATAAAAVLPVAGIASQAQQQKPSTGLINYDTDSIGMAKLGIIPGDTLMADFAQTPDGLLLATTDGSTIHIFRVGEQLDPITEYRFSDRKLHSLSWWQPSPGTSYLVVSGSAESPPTTGTSTETTPLSSVLQLSAGRLQPINENVIYFLGAFDRNGDGVKEILLGQSLDLDNFYGRVVQLQRQGNKLKSSSLELSIPQLFPVQGSILADLTADGKPETVTLRSGLLTIYQGRRKLYQTRKEFGGSISQLSYDTNPDQVDALFTTVSFEVNPVAADIDGDGQWELIAITSKHPTFSATFGTRPDISDLSLAVFKYQDGSFIKGDISAKSDHPIQGLYVDKGRILLVTSGYLNEMNQGPVSQLMAVSLTKVAE